MQKSKLCAIFTTTEHDNTNKLPQQTSPVEQPEGESSRAEVDKPDNTTARKLGEKGTQAARLTDEEAARIEEFDKHKALMEELPEGVDPRAVRRNQALRAKDNEWMS
ncbi:hypothetical protein HG434_000360 [Candidatus Saccharibacteria bacterium]|nr:hypothetical protein [Candidatus Saccharibacteria bacterium]